VKRLVETHGGAVCEKHEVRVALAYFRSQSPSAKAVDAATEEL